MRISDWSSDVGSSDLIEPNDAELHHLVYRAVDRLPRHAEIARDVRRAHDAADDIGHHHRLRAIDVGPAMIVKPRLQSFVEPAEELKKRADKLVGAHVTLCCAQVYAGMPTPSRDAHGCWQGKGG